MVQLFFFLQDNSGDQAKSGHAIQLSTGPDFPGLGRSLGDLASSRNPVHDGDPTRQGDDPTRHADDQARLAGDPTRPAGDPARHAGDPARHAGDPTRHAGDPARHVRDPTDLVAGDPERSARGRSLEQPITAGQAGGSTWNLMGLMTLKRNKKK
jgi:hypothetical protein